MVDISNKLIDLLKKLARADQIVSVNLENMDLTKEILVPKWKIWLLLRIFGEGGNAFVEDDSILLLDQVDESFRWEELSTETRLAGYGHNEDIISALVNEQQLKEEIGNIDDILDNIRRYIPEKTTTLKTSFNHSECIVESEIVCKSENKETIKINIGYFGKTAIQWCEKTTFISKGQDEGIYGPNANRVSISEIIYNILKNIGVINDDYINSNKILDLVDAIEEKIKGYKIKLVEEEDKDFDEANNICNALRYWMFIRILKTTMPTGIIMDKIKDYMSPTVEKLYMLDNDQLDLVRIIVDFNFIKEKIDEIHDILSPEAKIYIGDCRYDKTYYETGLYGCDISGKDVRIRRHELEIGIKNIFANDLDSSFIVIKVFRTNWSGLWIGVKKANDDEVKWLSYAGVQDMKELVKDILNWTRETEQN